MVEDHALIALDLETMQTRTIPSADCGFAYRSSIFNSTRRGKYVLLSVTYALTPVFNVDLTAEADAAVNQDGHGRHLAYSAIFGVDAKLSSKIGATAELSLARDEDPSGHASPALAGLSMDWTPNDHVQLDIGANFGLNHDSPDAEIYVGIARRF